MMNIRSIDNFFTDSIIDKIDQEIKQTGWQYGWPSRPGMSFSHWNMDFAQVIVENGLDVSDKLPDAIKSAWQHVNTNYFPGHRLIRCYANAHTYGVEGYPHQDSSKTGEQTVVVYMNPTWNRDWGGETLIYDGNRIVHAEIPQRNSALIFPSKQYHTSRGVTRICPELRITLMFKIASPESIDSVRDQIQEFLESSGANKKIHSKNSLSGHLLRVYDRLKRIGQPQDVCSAGGMHSIFGTNIYQNTTVAIEEKDQIAKLIGERAAYLVEIFSKLSRPATLERSIDVDNCKLLSMTGEEIVVDLADLHALAAIESANLHDQNSLVKMSNLHKFWQELNKV
jgi:hypothetical protein